MRDAGVYNIYCLALYKLIEHVLENIGICLPGHFFLKTKRQTARHVLRNKNTITLSFTDLSM